MIEINEQTVFADRYQFIRLLGRGGFSEVWLAKDKLTNLEVAVKVYAPGQGMDTDGMKEFCQELSQVYNLNHTNLLKPQHVDNWEGMPYLVLTYCPKGSCHRLIGTMNEKQIWKMLHDVASGLAYLHEQEIIHQDIKPDNILIDPQGNYVITDFGISVKSRATLRKSMNIASGGGTTAYMGPERFSKDPTPLKASDIWSLGATAYELLTGMAPFGEIGGGLQKGGADLPTIKKDISPELRAVLTKMLALETWDRPTAELLEQWTANPKQIDFSAQPSEPVRQKDVSSNTSSTRGGKGLKIGIVVFVLALLLGGAGLAFYWSKSEPKPDENGKRYQWELKEKCEKRIGSLNERNLLDELDNTVEALRDLERLEKDSPFKPQQTFTQDKMNDFLGKLANIQDFVELTLDKYEKDRIDKDGLLYKKEILKKERIENVFRDVENSKDRSPRDIHLRSDEF